MDENGARGFLSALCAPEHLHSGWMQMSCHLLRHGGLECLGVEAEPGPFSQGASLTQRGIRTHARRTLALREERQAVEYISAGFADRNIGASA